MLAIVIAVPADADTTLHGWAKEADFPFVLASDAGGATGQAYGAWIEKNRVDNRFLYVIGPDGSPLTVADLPPKDTKRWVIRRKAEVVAAVRGGLLSLEEACNRYTLTVDEFLSWQMSIDQHGLAGLRTTRIQQYRN